MTTTYYFIIGAVKFLLNIQHSKIGYAYPRLFMKFEDGSCANLDLTIGQVLGMKSESWDSWIDDDLIRLDNPTEITAKLIENGVSYKRLCEWVETLAL
jgi:hypothetical protein